MNICTQCAKEMVCIKTGKVAIWHGKHCYAGDEFECPECGSTALICAKESFENTNALVNYRGDERIDMTPETYKECKDE